jgi:DNA-directed RNA polymerase III subunit RPC3
MHSAMSSRSVFPSSAPQTGALTDQRIASTLLNKGRLALFSVHRLSGLPRSTVVASLMILHQHNLLYTNGANLDNEGAEEIYEFNVAECLLRLRWPRILAIAHSLFDDRVRHFGFYALWPSPRNL